MNILAVTNTIMAYIIYVPSIQIDPSITPMSLSESFTKILDSLIPN